MKIICITPIKHLSGLLDKMKQFGEVIYEPTVKKNELSSILKNDKTIDVLFSNPNKQNYKLDKDVLCESSLKVINTASTGTNHIDLQCCKELGIKVISLKNDIKLIEQLPSTSELAFGIMLSLLRKIPNSFSSVKLGKWDYEPFIGDELASLSIGIIGFGRLGKYMASYCKAFSMSVHVYDPYKTATNYNQCSLEDIAACCDVISLHVHVTNETKYMINYDLIKVLDKQPIIINTSRGEIVREKDIILGLKEGKIKGYGTDVIEDEFGEIDNSPIIRGIKSGYNILVTPHIGGMTWQGQYRAFKWAINKFKYISEYLERGIKIDLV